MKAARDADRAKVDAERARLESRQDDHANFAYILAYADAIRTHRRADPVGKIDGMVTQLEAFVCAHPLSPDYFLEIRDLEGLGVDLSFFLD